MSFPHLPPPFTAPFPGAPRPTAFDAAVMSEEKKRRFFLSLFAIPPPLLFLGLPWKTVVLVADFAAAGVRPSSSVTTKFA